MKKGLFITMEGPDGAGKSTQLHFIKSFLEEKGEKAIFTREPGGTPISEKIRKIILDKNNSDMVPMAEALLYAAARAQLVSQVIKPALERGKIVVCDRFVDSSIVYQGYGRGLGESVNVINDYAVAGCIPDITFLMKLAPDLGKSRIKTENKDRIESENSDFHENVYRGYIELEKRYPDRIVTIDAKGTIEEVSREIGAQLERILKNRNDFQ